MPRPSWPPPSPTSSPTSTGNGPPGGNDSAAADLTTATTSDSATADTRDGGILGFRPADPVKSGHIAGGVGETRPSEYHRRHCRLRTELSTMLIVGKTRSE